MNRMSRPRRAPGVCPLLTALLAAPLFLAAPALAAETGAVSGPAPTLIAALPVTGPQAPPQGMARGFAQGAAPVPPPASLPAAPAAAPKAPAQAKDPARITPAAPTQAMEKAAASTDGSEDTELVLACKARALTLLRQKSPEIEDITIDMDGLTVARAELSVGETRIHTVMMGEAYIQRDKTDKIHRFLCLTGEKGEVLLTFFTER